MIRSVYSGLMWLAQPFLRARLKRRGLAEPGYLVAMEERFGHYAASTSPAPSDHPDAGYLWVHAVSLGETRVAALLISRLRERWPGMHLLLTHGTATGREEGAKLLRSGDIQVWQPWDTPGNVNRFLDHYKPRMGILLETEIWPNLSAICKIRGVPLVLVNARLSDKSLRQARRLNWLARPAYGNLTAVWAQTQDDAKRLKQLGASVQGVFGNLKFDASPDASQVSMGRRGRDGLGQPVVLFASSREGEESQFLEYLKKNERQVPVEYKKFAIENVVPYIQWLIVPRHPQRFDEVAQLMAHTGYRVSRRKTWLTTPPGGPLEASIEVPPWPLTLWLGDSLGEMALYYGLADVALLGGSFEPLGGQNLIEAAACGCPVIMGPHTFNFAEAAELAIDAGAAIRVGSMAQAVHEAQSLLADGPRLEAMKRAALNFTAAHRGALDKTVAAVSAVLEGPAIWPAVS